MAKIEYRPDSAEFYAGDNFYRSGEIAAYCTTDSALSSAKAYNDLNTLSFAAKGVNGDCGGIGTITTNTCTVGSYEPIALKTDVSEIEDALKGVIARVAALEDSMPRKDNLRRQLKTLNYKREL
jgi:hypothetical protein